jgi:dolichol-phosphate mannosyltransferase
MKKIVIIPTYNEKENIQKIIPLVLEQNLDLDILVVDDNSPDKTAKIVEDLAKKLNSPKGNINLLLRKEKNGLGQAYIAGFNWALQKNYDIIIQMDADLSHNPKYLKKMLDEIKDHDLVIGSRYVKNGGTEGWTLDRKIISRGGSLYSNMVLWTNINDLTGGFKCWRNAMLKKINLDTITSNGYSFQIEMNYRAYKLGAKIKEIPIIFVDRNIGASKMSKNIVWEAMWKVWKLKFETR